nr:uncharacterized protein LOC6622394 isoform X2 [Drosophila virilis]
MSMPRRMGDIHRFIWLPNSEGKIYTNYYGMFTRPIGTLWIGVEISHWTTVASGPVFRPQRAVKFKRCGTAADTTEPGEIKARKKHTIEKDLGFLRIGSLNVRVKKTTEAFSNFLGVGNGSVPMPYGTGGAIEVGRHHQRTHRHPHQRHHHHANGMTRDRPPNQRASVTIPYGSSNIVGSRSSVPTNRNIYDAVHKSWGSADNITQRSENLMPPPKSVDYVSKRYRTSKRSSYASNATDSPRDSICSSNSSSNLNTGYSSMPTTPNQIRAPKSIGSTLNVDSDSDSACGFDSNWSVNDGNSINNNVLRS